MMHYGDYPDHHTMRFIESYLRCGDSFLDVGANIGLYSILAAQVIGKNGWIVAVEPDPVSANRFRENMEINHIGNYELHKCAASNANGSARFLVGQDATNHIVAANEHSGTFIQVPVRRLDELTGERSFDLMKLDVEGTELMALRGAGCLVSVPLAPLIVFEVNGSLYRYGIEETELFAYLKGFGYELGMYDSTNCILDCRARLWDDVVAIHQDAISKLRERIPNLSLER